MTTRPRGSQSLLDENHCSRKKPSMTLLPSLACLSTLPAIQMPLFHEEPALLYYLKKLFTFWGITHTGVLHIVIFFYKNCQQLEDKSHVQQRQSWHSKTFKRMKSGGRKYDLNKCFSYDFFLWWSILENFFSFQQSMDKNKHSKVRVYSFYSLLMYHYLVFLTTSILSN